MKSKINHVGVTMTQDDGHFFKVYFDHKRLTKRDEEMMVKNLRKSIQYSRDTAMIGKALGKQLGGRLGDVAKKIYG